MIRPRVLSVGQCGFDHGAISRLMGKHFDAEVIGVGGQREALSALGSASFDLILVNRVGDRDGAPGLDLIRRVRSDPALSSVPIMLVSNYPEAQSEAVALGAIPGFGKAELHAPRTLASLAEVLRPPIAPSDRPEDSADSP